MSKIYVLGAGAPRDANIPLTNEIIPRILKENPNIHEEPLRISTISLHILVDYLKEIAGNEYLSSLDIEDLLSITYFPLVLKELTQWDDNKISNFRRHLIWGILFEIEKALNNNRNQYTYQFFTKMIDEKDSIISLNYDLLFEKFLIEKFGTINYNLDLELLSESGMKDEYTYSDFNFIKLHGSMNLFYCDCCHKFTPMNYPNAMISEDPNLHIGNIKIACPADDGGNLIAVIIPPAGEKSEVAPILRPCWEKAFNLLKVADDIFFIGISFRENDIWLRFLFQSSICMNKNVKLHYITNKISDDKRDKIISLFQNKSIEFIEDGFAGWISKYYGLGRFY